MAIQLAVPPVDDPVAYLIAELEVATSPSRVEALAAQLGAGDDRRAVRPLISRLCDRRVQADRRVELALCYALASLSVMRSLGDSGFAFLPRHLLAPDAVDAVEDLDSEIPLRYFLARSR